jgi:hypothetical protein
MSWDGPGPLAKLRLLVKAAEDNRLHEADFKVLAVLVDTIGRAGAGWWGFGTVAERIGKHRSAVVRSVAKLELLGYIRCHRTGGGSKENTTKYEMGQGPSSSTDATGSTHATSSTHAPDQSHPRTLPVAPTRHESVLQSVIESVEEQSSLRSDSSSPSADDPGDQGAEGKATPPADLSQRKAERLVQVTIDAIEAFNAVLGKPNGLLPAVNAKVGIEKRRQQVKRCLRVARQICEQEFGAPTVTPEFWSTYFAEVDRDPFKSGKQAPGRGHENWKPSFEYLTREAVMLAVFDSATSEAA